MRRIVVTAPGARTDEGSGSAPGSGPTGATANPFRVTKSTFSEERGRALGVARDAMEVMTKVMERTRQGKELAVAPLEDVTTRIVASVSRNADALRSLGSLRRQDRYTFEHSVGVAVLAGSFGLTLGLSAPDLHDLALAALLHDLGKALTPNEVLNKPGRLDPQELEVMRHHVVDSRRLLELSGFSEQVVRGAAQHHERHDGSGYPNGLRGEGISLFGRVIGISDVFDALTANRVYRRGQTPTLVLRDLLAGAGREFEPSLVHRFIQSIGIYPAGTLVRLESSRLAVVVERGERDLLRPLVRVFYDADRLSYLKTVDLDLAVDHSDTILGCERPDRWGLRPHLYLE